MSRRLSRLPAETNKALAAAAVVGSRFALDLVEQVVGQDLVDAFDEACKAGIVIEEPGGRYRFNHAIVRQSLLAELASVRRIVVHSYCGTTSEGFDAEWREVALLTIDGDKLNRCELYDEEDIEAAIARFDKLHPHATNATT